MLNSTFAKPFFYFYKKIQSAEALAIIVQFVHDELRENIWQDKL